MQIIVLAKQVPDIEKVQFQKDNGWVDRKSADAEINPFDLNAIEAAQQLKRSSERPSRLLAWVRRAPKPC